jgi:hypothetical protein
MKLLLGLLFTFFTIQALAYTNGQVQNAPWNQPLRDIIEQSTTNGEHVNRFMHSFYDVTLQGGTTVGTYNLNTNVKGHPLQQIPAKSVIKQVYFYVAKNFLGVATSGTTFTVSCGNATLFSASDISTKPVGAIFAGNQTGTAATMSDVGTSPCTPTVTIGTQGYTTQGQADVYIDFVTHN